MKETADGSVLKWRSGTLALLVLAFVANTVAIYAGLFDGRSSAPDDAAMRGRSLWQVHNCQACHQLFGLGGYMGPDLTNVAQDRDPDRLRAFIRYGTGRMPAHPLDDTDIDALIAFLALVDRHGSSRVPPEHVHWSGTYIIPTGP